MNNNVKIILSALIAAGVVSLLFFVVPVTDTFITSYIFALIAIAGIAGSLCIYGKGAAKTPQGFAYGYIAIVYAVCSSIFSLIACLFHFDLTWTIIIHAAVLAVFVIIAIAISAGNQHIDSLDEKSAAKHAAFEKEKETYWK